VSVPPDVLSAYGFCEAVTRAQAANFYYGIRLLPRERRRAMCAVYAFARRVDDIGDGALAHEEKLRLLDAEDQAVETLRAGRPCSPADRVMVALADAHARFSLPLEALGELIAGVRMDVNGTSYERFEDLVLYCRRVAGAIGRVSLAIFARSRGAPAGRHHAERLADDLGVALQLTNILRDVREDAENGRVYLPAEDLRRFGLAGAGGPQPAAAGLPAALAQLAGGSAGSNGAGHQAGQLYELMRFEAARAGEWFDRGLELVPLLDRRSAACVLAMAGIYRRLLERIEQHPEQAAQRRISLPTHEKALVAARSMLGGRV
jgi:phytoene synthase